MAHEKTIAQSRDRQGADPLADARGSVHISIFGPETHSSIQQSCCTMKLEPRGAFLLGFAWILHE
jgi:hypothetical protein